MKEMSLDSTYNRMKEFNKLLISFKALKTTKKKKNNSKRSQLRKMSTSFTKSITMPIKVIMIVKMS